MSPNHDTKPSLISLTHESLRLGALGFGGPAGQIALMHQRFVSEKNWIDEDQYLHALSFCMLLPGPEAQQLATYIGWRLQGVWGGVVAGLGFVLPGAAIMLALSWLYVMAADLAGFEPVLMAIRAVVVVVIFSAIAKLAAKAIVTSHNRLLAGISFVSLLVLQVPFPIIIIAALLIGWWSSSSKPSVKPVSAAPIPFATTLIAIALWSAVWLAPLALVWLWGSPFLVEVGALFSGLSMVTFGGAYASTVWLKQYAVDGAGWISAGNMLDGLGLVQAIPGPLVLINQFVGFVAGWQQGGLGLALGAAALASWCTFAPSFLWIFAGAPYGEAMRHHARLAGALAGVRAAIVGVMAYLGVWFGVGTLFSGQIAMPEIAGRAWSVPDPTSLNIAVLAMIGVALICQLVAKWGLLVTLAITIGFSLVMQFGLSVL